MWAVRAQSRSWRILVWMLPKPDANRSIQRLKRFRESPCSAACDHTHLLAAPLLPPGASPPAPLAGARLTASSTPQLPPHQRRAPHERRQAPIHTQRSLGGSTTGRPPFAIRAAGLPQRQRRCRLPCGRRAASAQLPMWHQCAIGRRRSVAWLWVRRSWVLLWCMRARVLGAMLAWAGKAATYRFRSFVIAHVRVQSPTIVPAKIPSWGPLYACRSAQSHLSRGSLLGSSPPAASTPTARAPRPA